MTRRFRSKNRPALIGFAVTAFVLVSTGLVGGSTLIGSQLSGSERHIEPTEQVQIDRALTGELLFNDAPKESIISDRIVEAIDRATDSVTLVMYSIDMTSVRDAMERAALRGVRVRAILDIGKRAQHNRLFSKESPVELIEVGDTTGQLDNHMHHKYVLIDANTESARFIGGALNLTANQEAYDPSFMIDTSDPDFIAPFIAETERLAEGIRGHQKLAKTDFRPFSHRLDYRDGWVEAWFSPGLKGNSASDRLLELIEGATESLDVMIWQCTTSEIAHALVKKAHEGVRVRVITDDFYIWGGDSAFRILARAMEQDPELPIELISDMYRTVDPNNVINVNQAYFNPYLHQHTLIVDEETVFTGSNNWSFNGFLSSDESMIVTNVPWITKGFVDSFAYHYGELQNAPVAHTWEGDVLRIEQSLDGVSRLEIYHEESEKTAVPQTCFQASADQLREGIAIPSTCRGIEFVALLLSSDHKIMGGLRLQ